MSNPIDILQLKEELKKIQEQTRKSRRRAVFGFGVLVLVMVISFAYAFVQQVAAQKNAEITFQLEKIAREKEKQALLAEEMAIRARDQAEEISARLRECQASRK